MQKLICDITLGGSTTQFLEWHKRNSNQDQFIYVLNKALYYRAKTKPVKLASRLGALIGLVYDQFEGDSYMLDCIITAFQQGSQ